MKVGKSYGKFDQGVFNAACKLVDEISKRNHLHFLLEIDATNIDEYRREQKNKNLIAPSYTAVVVKAAAFALRGHPHLNCIIQERPFFTRLIPLKHITATIAVERMVRGVDMVFAPMIRDVDSCSLRKTTKQLQFFAEVNPNNYQPFRQFIGMTKLAKHLPALIGRIFAVPGYSKKLWEKYRGGSFVVTSPGKYGGCDQVLPPWPWPLTFSFGNVKVRPWVDKGVVVPRKTMRLTITADRRLANGAPLARFAEDVRCLLENPKRLVGAQSEEAHFDLGEFTVDAANDQSRNRPVISFRPDSKRSFYLK